MKIILTIVILLFANIAVALPTQPYTQFYWTNPTTNTDDTPLTDLAGTRLYCGSQAGSYSLISDIADPSINTESFVSAGLIDGEWFCAKTAYTTDNRESAYSNEVVFILVNGVVPVIVPRCTCPLGIR